MSLASSTRIAIEVIDLETGTQNTYSSMSAVARALNTQPSSIQISLNSKRKVPYKKRYIIQKID